MTSIAKNSIPRRAFIKATAETTGQHGGDNPVFIRKMIGFFSRNRDWITYETYFNSDRHRLHASGQPTNPASSAAYREAFAAIPAITA